MARAAKEEAAPSDATPASHAARVFAVAEGQASAPGAAFVSTSWQRCVNEFGVDPAASVAPRVLTLPELRHLREPIKALIESARDELDRLYALVRPAGYTVLLADKNGVAVEHRGDEAQAGTFKYWGIWLGGVWTESVEGTNGIGTCIAEAQPVTIHRNQHLRSRHIDLSCSGAPIFDVDGTLLAVLDVSSFDPTLSEGAHTLTGTLTAMSARSIEERFFRERFHRSWIVALTLPQESGPSALLALDGERRVVGANRVARKILAIDDEALAGDLAFSSLFYHDERAFARSHGADIPTRMVCTVTGEEVPALVTPPESAVGFSSLAFHTRPRSDLLATVRQFVLAPQPRGGLSPATMRRVKEHVEAHLENPIELAELAEIAGLSVYHFAREFKRSAGVTPHHYLVQKRVERAQTLLARSDLSPTEIAHACGFADQSHLARRFRQVLGMTPGEFRRSLQ